MPSHRIKFSDGTVAIVHMSPQKKKFCACGRPCTKLCDFDISPPSQVTHRRTCDKPLCDRCAVHAGPELDYCKPHAEMIDQRNKEVNP